MKHIKVILLALLLTCGVTLFADAASTAFAGSYLTRANNLDAAYWNPALLSDYQAKGVEVNLVNFGLNLANNSISLDTYNSINGDSLSASDKNDLLSDMENKVSFNVQAHSVLLGAGFKQQAITVGAHTYGQGHISKQWLELILNGNTDHYDHPYYFNKQDNTGAVMSWVDLTYARGQLLADLVPQINAYDYLKDIQVGVSLSVLKGIYLWQVQDYDGVLRTSDTGGLSVQQQLHTRTAEGGLGFTSRLGFSWSDHKNWSAGLAFDNIAGFINWDTTTEYTDYAVDTDSLYVVDMSEDIFEQADTTYAAPSFTTTLPFTMHMAGMYEIAEKGLSFSADWRQVLSNSAFVADDPEISLGAQWLVTPNLPLRLGVKFPSSNQPFTMGYGIGWLSNRFDIELGFSTYDSFIPSDSALGMGLALSSRLRF